MKGRNSNCGDSLQRRPAELLERRLWIPYNGQMERRAWFFSSFSEVSLLFSWKHINTLCVMEKQWFQTNNSKKWPNVLLTVIWRRLGEQLWLSCHQKLTAKLLGTRNNYFYWCFCLFSSLQTCSVVLKCLNSTAPSVSLPLLGGTGTPHPPQESMKMPTM